MRQMQTEVRLRILTGILNDFTEPRAGNHDTTAHDLAILHTVDRSRVRLVRHANIVGIHDQQSVCGLVAKTFSEGLCIHGKCGQQKQDYAEV
jgi:hypothetical protein